eukprot:7473094-Pyramimonas_sp.AAC.1
MWSWTIEGFSASTTRGSCSPLLNVLSWIDAGRSCSVSSGRPPKPPSARPRRPPAWWRSTR